MQRGEKEEPMYRFDTRISSAVRATKSAGSRRPRKAPTVPLTDEQLRCMQCYWQAANYLTIGQIYLQDNPLLRRPLRMEDIKPRLLGHWAPRLARTSSTCISTV